MSDLSWEETEIDDKPFSSSSKQQTTEDDWEDFDLDAVEKKQQEELKKKQEQIAEAERQEKLKKQQQQKEKTTKKAESKVSNRSSTNAPAGEEGKKVEGMYLDYMEKKTSYDEAEALIGGAGSEFAKPKIDLLSPKTEKEFNEFGVLVADKLLEFEESKFYLDLIKNVIEEATINWDSAQLRELTKHVTNVSNKRMEEEKEKKAGGKKKKKTVNIERDISSSSDPFADLGDGTGGRTKYDDDDFM